MSCFLAFWTASIPEIRRSHTVWKIMDVCVGSEVIGKTDWPLVFKVFGYQGWCNTLKKSLWQMPSKKVIESVFFSMAWKLWTVLEKFEWILGRLVSRVLPYDCHSSMHVIIFVRHIFSCVSFLSTWNVRCPFSYTFIFCRFRHSKIGNSKLHIVSKTCHGNTHLYVFVKVWMQNE